VTAVRVAVTAEHIAEAGAWPMPPAPFPRGWLNPVEIAIAARAGVAVDVSGDGAANWIATIGTGRSVLVVDLPEDANTALNRLWNGEPMSPFEFSIELDHWLVGMVHEALDVERARRLFLHI
jgi:hypothetical protein